MATFRVLLAWIFFLAGAGLGAHLVYTRFENGLVGPDPLLAALILGYSAWSLYWGWPVVWRLWRQSSTFKTPGLLRSVLLTIPLTLLILLVGGFLYGVLGGGLYQHLKYTRRAHQRSG